MMDANSELWTWNDPSVFGTTKNERRKQWSAKYSEVNKCWNEIVVHRKALYSGKVKRATFASLQGGVWHHLSELGERFRIEGPKDKKPDYGDIPFKDVCQVTIRHLKVLNAVHHNKLLVLETFSEVEYQLQNKEIKISVYGDGNVGKSTLINSMVGDSYLPMNKRSETAVSVYIHFDAPQLRSEGMCDIMEDILCDYKIKTVARGPEDIKKKLGEINKKTRAGQQSELMGSRNSNTALKYHLFLYRPHMDINGRGNSGPRFILLDNPGYDEYDCGTGTVTKAVRHAQLISSAYVFVITFDNYTKMEASKQLKALYMQSKDIFQEKRLTIVINKIDEAVEEEFDQPQYTKEQVVSDIRKHLCQNIFLCSEDDLPEDAVIAVSGSNALLARVYQKKPNSKIEKKIRAVISDSSLGPSSEIPKESIASILEEMSNIRALEMRLTDLSQKASRIWKQKMCSDLLTHMKKMKRILEEQLQAKEKYYSDLKMELQQMHKELLKLKIAYYDIVHPAPVCKRTLISSLYGAHIWQTFTQACSEDMKKDNNIRIELLNSTSEKLETFKILTSDKIAQGEYTADCFEKDLMSFFQDISRDMARNMSSWDSFYHMSKACSKANMEVEKTTNDLKAVIGVSLKMQEDEDVSCFPDLSGPSFKIAVDIPFGERTFLQKVWLKMKTLFLRLPQPGKSYKVELEEDLSATLDHRKVSQDVPSAMESKESFPSTPACIEGSIESSTSTNDSRSPEEPLSSESKRVTYKKWSPELEEMKENIRIEITETINAFFNDLDRNIIQKCCEQHFEAARHILENFDECAEEYFQKFKRRFEVNVKDFKQTNEELEKFQEDLQCVKYMIEKIKTFNSK